MSRPVRIAAVQHEPYPGDLEDNLSRAVLRPDGWSVSGPASKDQEELLVTLDSVVPAAGAHA